MRSHFERYTRFSEDSVQIEFAYSPSVNEITLITPDRPLLFANMAGALAAWGMNIITADAFANRQGVVVDSFRFTDSFSYARNERLGARPLRRKRSRCND